MDGKERESRRGAGMKGPMDGQEGTMSGCGCCDCICVFSPVGIVTFPMIGEFSWRRVGLPQSDSTVWLAARCHHS